MYNFGLNFPKVNLGHSTSGMQFALDNGVNHLQTGFKKTHGRFLIERDAIFEANNGTPYEHAAADRLNKLMEEACACGGRHLFTHWMVNNNPDHMMWLHNLNISGWQALRLMWMSMIEAELREQNYQY